nr:reverse transcriptase domain-containing protein [Tanacetum cinerariifolium]
MSTNEQTPLSQPTSAMRNTLGKKQAPQNLVRHVSDEDLREYCDKTYHQILPIIVEKLHQEKAQQEKLKAVKARLNFEETSQYSESETSNKRRNLKERLGRRRRMCPHIQEARSESHTIVVAGTQKAATKVLALKKQKLLPRNIVTKESIREERKKCQKVKEVQEGTGSQNQRSKSRVWRTTHPNHRSEDPEDHLKIFQAASKTERWAMPTWCHMFNFTLTGNARVWFDDLPKESIDSYEGLRKAFLKITSNRKMHQRFGEEDGTEGPMIIEAEMGGHCVHRIYVDGGSSSEILYEHCFSKFRPEIKNHLIPANTPLVEFSREIIWPQEQISLLVRIGDEEHSTSAWMNFMVVRSPSPYNGIIGSPGVRKIRAIPSTAHGMIKFPMAGGIVTLQSSRIIPLECSIVSKPGVPRSSINQVREEKIKVAIHLEYPEQTVAIGSALTEEGRKELCGLLRHHLDVQKKMGQAPERNKAISEEVKKFVEADIMKEVHYPSWLSNPVMDGYPLPKIDWTVESLCGYIYKCFLDAYKGYHQIKMAEEDEKKTAFITSQGILCYSKIPFGLKNAGATYQRLVDKDFQKQIGRNLDVYVDNLVIKSRTKKEVIRDIEETFKTLRKINMKLNPKKCAFGIREGTFLGYKVDVDGLRVSPNKVKAVLDLPSPKCLKDVQKQNGKLAKRAFKEMKQSIAELLMLTAPKEKEELIMYLAAAKEAISAVLITERDGKQVPVYFVSRALKGQKINYTPMEKLIIALEVTGRLLKWRFELGEHDIQYRLRTSVKGQILADFIVERLEDDAPDTPIEDMEELPDPWILSIKSPSKCGLKTSGQPGILPEEKKKARTVRHKAGRYAVINEVLYKKSFFGPWLRCIGPLQANYVLREIHEGSCSMHAGPRSVVAKNLSQWPGRKSKQKPRRGNQGTIVGKNKNCVEEVSHVLWAHRIMIKSSNGDTPFSLTYGAEAVIPDEIDMSTLRIAEVDMVKNNEALGISLDLLEEKREQAAIQEARNKAKMEGYYNVRVRSTSFRPGDFVYRSNVASHAKDGGKLGPKWEGPYEVTEALDKGAYRLRDRMNTPFREHGISATLKSAIYMKCKHPLHVKQSGKKDTDGILFVCNIFKFFNE